MLVSVVNELVECQQPPGKNHKNRAVQALREVGEYGLATLIDDCRRGKTCGSLYCPDCRHRFAKEAQIRMLDHIEGRIEKHGPDVEKELRYLTVLLDVVYPGDVARSVREARNQLKAFNRAFPSVWMQGMFEFDFINMRLLFGQQGKSRKRDVIKSMIQWNRYRSGLLTGNGLGLFPDDMVLVHFHCLVDLNGCSDTDVRDWWAKKNHTYPLASGDRTKSAVLSRT